MKRFALVLLALAAAPLYADSTLWYNGDANGVNGLANEVNSSVSQAYVFDDFVVGAGGETLTGAFSNNLMNFTATTADVEILSGVSSGNGGTTVFSAFGTAATQTATGRNAFGYNEYTIDVSLPDVVLSPGTYWLVVAPDGSGSGSSYVSTTSGANCVGLPCGNNDNSFFDSSSFSANFAPASTQVTPPADFSMGITGDSAPPVPEPSSFLLLGSGLFAAFGAVRRKISL
jgi:hypothetical protein